MALQAKKMSKASNYMLEHCIEKFSRINLSDFAMGYLVEKKATASYVNFESQIVIHSETLTANQNEKITDDLIEHLFSGACPRTSFFCNADNPLKYPELLSNPNINNIRYISIAEGNKFYAVVILVNIEFSVTTKTLMNIEPFLLASIALFKNREHQNKLSSALVDIKNKDQGVVESLLQKTFHPTFIFDDEFKVLKSNAASQRLFNSNIDRGWPSIDKIINKTLPSIATRLLNTISKYYFLGHLDREEWADVELIQNAYQTIKVDVSLFALEFRGSNCFCLMLNEKLQNKITEDNFQASLERFNALTTVVPMAILQVDKDWNCSYVNETWSRYTGLLHEQSMHKGWLSCLPPQSDKEFLPALMREISLAKSFQDEIELITVDKQRLWVSINAIGLFNEKYEPTGIIITINDISEAKMQAQRLQKMASHDHLTGLSNRAFFNDRLSVALSRVGRHGITAVMFLDLDRFKLINDTLGHPVGDKVIQEVARRLTTTIRDEDSIARLGGDEFAIIFTDVKTEAILASIATKIVNSLHLPLSIDERTLTISCSIGIAIAESKKTTTADILRKADLALYKAKKSGRDQFHFYDIALEQDISILNCLRESLNNINRNDFSLVFQPQVNAVTHNVVGFEVLSRWHSPTLGIIGPETFIKILEENQLIDEFSHWLLPEAIVHIKHWQTNNLLCESQKIAINISAKQLHTVELADMLIALFQSEEINPNTITIEVTETAFIQDPNVAGINLRKLKSAGFSIALDDFGTGYSSLGLLRKMPLDYIKIDRSFINDILYDEEAEKIVLAILGLASMLKLGIIAEGVENCETKEWLLAHGSVIHQGYYYYKPLSIGDTKLLLNESENTDNIIELSHLVDVKE